MAAQYDMLGNYIGDFETEEERQKREEEQRRQTVQTQTVTTAADGTQTVTTKQVAQPTAVAAPISPDTYQRMIQAESGGQNFTAQGQPLTSPKGAMFAAQVMPATAAQPGFGVRPAQAQTAEEYNRVGQEYYQALLRKYNGNEQLAAAAYNMGPGAVDQNLARNQGQFNVAQAPRETQGYLGKVFQGAGQAITNMFPSAQAGTLPQPSAGAGRGTFGMPQVQPEPGVAVATGRGVQGTMTLPEQAAAQPQPPAQPTAVKSSQPYIDIYQRDQNDPLQMLALRGDTEAPEFIRRRAGDRARELMNQETQTAQAQQQAQQLAAAAAQGDRKASNTIARTLQSQEGSWLKMILLGFISPQLAGLEAVKLGFGNVDRPVQDANGKNYMVTYNALGTPVSGFSADGKTLSQEELINVTAGAAGKLNIVGGSYVNDTTGEVGRMVTDEKTGRSYIQTDTGRKPMEGFRPQSSAGTLADQRARLIQELNLKLQGKTQEEKMAITRDYNSKLVGAGYQPVQPYEVNLQAPQIAQPAAQPAAGAVPPAAAQPAAQGGEVRQLPQTVAPPAQTQPAAAPAAVATPVSPTVAQPATGTRPTATQLEAQRTQATTEAKEAGEDIAKVRANQGKNEATSDYLITKIDELVKHPGFSVSVGASAQPGFQFIPGTDKASWYARFDEVKGQAFLQAFETLRGGGQITEREGAAATAALQRMNTSQSEAEFKEAANDFINVVKRTVDRNRVKLGQEPKYGTAPESQLAGEKKIERLSAEDRRAVEWARQNPNDPRSAEIKRRLGL